MGAQGSSETKGGDWVVPPVASMDSAFLVFTAKKESKLKRRRSRKKQLYSLATSMVL